MSRDNTNDLLNCKRFFNKNQQFCDDMNKVLSLKEAINYLYRKLHNIKNISDYAKNIKESALFNMSNLRSNEIMTQIEDLETRLELEQRKAKIGMHLINSPVKRP